MMKPNLTDPAITHSTAALSKQERRMADLCNSILPVAQLLVREGIAVHMKQAANAVDNGEAEILLRSMLTELNDTDSAALAEALATANRVVHHEQVDSGQSGWADKMGEDFALAAAAFWINYCDTRDASGRAEQGDRRVPETGNALAEFNLLASRYYVAKANVLWTTLHNDHGTSATESAGAVQPDGIKQPGSQQKALELH